MQRYVAALLLAVLALAATPASAGGTAHDFGFTAIEGGPLPLSQYRGKALLVVNTASFCGFTPQYAGLQSLWERYRDRGLVVLGVPSNDFGGQEPGSAGEIKSFCEVNFGIDFPMTGKQQVRGAGAHPFYRWASEALGPANAPSWNFHKYLVGPDGRLLGAYPSRVTPESEQLGAAVEAALPR
ncbi:MAG: glutathione peroxidase [Acetobacterales bacterium]